MLDKLYFDKEINDFLNLTYSSKISMILLNAGGSLINEVGNFIKREEQDYLSYLPISKYNPDEKPYEQKGRTKIRIGRFVKKFLSDNAIKELSVSDKDIEYFVNSFKSYFTPNKENIKVISGEELQKWYLEENYSTHFGSKIGTLWASCMRQRERNKFLELYSNNPGICSMLIFLDEDQKLRARALLWNVVDVDGKSHKIMDRIYTIYDYDVQLFKSWARQNDYIFKWEQNAKSERYFNVNGDRAYLNLKIQLENWNFAYWPYLDTFKYFNEYRGYLSNDSYFSYDYILVQSNGRLEPDPPQEEYYDDEN